MIIWRELTFYPAGNLQKTVYTDPLFDGHHNFQNTFRKRIMKFVQQVSDGIAPKDIDGKAEDALATQLVIEAAIESLENETVVYIR